MKRTRLLIICLVLALSAIITAIFIGRQRPKDFPPSLEVFEQIMNDNGFFGEMNLEISTDNNTVYFADLTENGIWLQMNFIHNLEKDHLGISLSVRHTLYNDFDWVQQTDAQQIPILLDVLITFFDVPGIDGKDIYDVYTSDRAKEWRYNVKDNYFLIKKPIYDKRPAAGSYRSYSIYIMNEAFSRVYGSY